MLVHHDLRQPPRHPIRRRATPHIAPDRLGQRIDVARRDRRLIGLPPSIQRLPHRLVLAAHGDVAHAQLAQRVVHVEEHRVEHRLRQRLPVILLAMDAVDQQEGIQPDHVEPPIHGIGHVQRGVIERVPRGANGSRVERETSPLMPLTAE